MRNNKSNTAIIFISAIGVSCVIVFAMGMFFGCDENIKYTPCNSNIISTVTATFYLQNQKNCTKCTDVICVDWCRLSETTNVRQFICTQNCTGGCEVQPSQCYDTFVNFINDQQK